MYVFTLRVFVFNLEERISDDVYDCKNTFKVCREKVRISSVTKGTCIVLYSQMKSKRDLGQCIECFILSLIILRVLLFCH